MNTIHLENKQEAEWLEDFWASHISLQSLMASIITPLINSYLGRSCMRRNRIIKQCCTSENSLNTQVRKTY